MRQRSTCGCSSFFLLLLFIFLILKVSGAVDWSWWWVTAPLWLPLVFILGVLAVMAVMGVSVYKILSAVLRRQDLGGAARPKSGSPEGDVLEAEGTEVRPAPRERRPEALPAADAGSDGEDGPETKG